MSSVSSPFPAANLLGGAESLYLRQHAHDPVHWRRWGEAALEEAAKQNRLIMVSSGYAACHWCHVMAKESFADPAIAAILNRYYTAIKLDREERPEIDAFLMRALALTGQPGGWPLTMFLTPEGQVFGGGTYFPKPVFSELLTRLATLHHEGGREGGPVLEKQAALLADALAEKNAPQKNEASEKNEPLARFLSLLDEEEGGFKTAPKFPCWALGEFLTIEGRRDKAAAQAAETLELALAKGGICDQLGGGFFRYATDRFWRWPHFEKMLYDNGLALKRLARASNKNPFLRRQTKRAVQWLLTEMQLEKGGFAASLDADQQKGEGAFYLWQEEEIESVLGAKEARFFLQFYRLHAPPEEKAAGGLPYCHALPESEKIAAHLETLLAELAAARQKRTPPQRDEKLLADSNALAIEGLCWAGFFLGESDWLDAAAQNWEQLFPLLTKEGQLHHCIYHGGSFSAPAIADDYAFTISAALTLFELLGKRDFLQQAEFLAAQFDEAFWHEAESGYAYAAQETETGFAQSQFLRPVEALDGAVPSAQGVMLGNCARLAALLPHQATHWQKRATQMMQKFGEGDLVAGAGLRVGRFLWQNPVLLTGDFSSLTQAQNKILREGWFSGLIFTHRLNEGQQQDEFLLCGKELCLAPATGAEELAARLKEARAVLQD